MKVMMTSLLTRSKREGRIMQMRGGLLMHSRGSNRTSYLYVWFGNDIACGISPGPENHLAIVCLQACVVELRGF